MKELIYFPSTNDHYGRCAKTVHIWSFFLSAFDLRISLNKGKHGPEKTLYLDYFYTLHKSIEDWIHKDWRVSDQISIAQIQMKPRNESEIKSNTKIMKKKMAPKYTTKRKSKDATTIKVVQVKSTL